MIAPTAPAIGLCADVGGSFVRLAPAAADGSLGPAMRYPTPTGDWDALCRLLREGVADLDPALPLSVSVAAALAPETGVATSANVPCLTGRPLAVALSEALGRPVTVANDAGCFVLAEALRGAGQGRAVVFGVVLGSGIGGGLVVDGRLVPGAGEWGHGPLLGALRIGAVDVPRLPCGCGGYGCLDTLGGARGLERLDTLMHGTSRSSLAVIGGWERGEALAAATVAAWLGIVAGPLVLAIQATGAAIVPVGGGLGRSRALVAALDRAVGDGLLGRPAVPMVVPAALGADAGLLGAALRLQRMA